MDRRPGIETCCSYKCPSAECRAHDLHAWSYWFFSGCYYRRWMWTCQTTSRTIFKGSGNTRSVKGSHFHFWGLPSFGSTVFFSLKVWRAWCSESNFLNALLLLGFCIRDQSWSGSRDACRRYNNEKSRAVVDASKACPPRKGLRRSKIVGSFGRTR